MIGRSARLSLLAGEAAVADRGCLGSPLRDLDRLSIAMARGRPPCCRARAGLARFAGPVQAVNLTGVVKVSASGVVWTILGANAFSGESPGHDCFAALAMAKTAGSASPAKVW